MARYDGKFLRGVIGPVILKKSGNKQQVIPRGRAGTVKQSAATKQASGTFGMASGLSGQIKAVLKEDWGIAGDGSVHARLSTALNQLLMRAREPVTGQYSFGADSFQGLAGFEFNAARRLADKLPRRLELHLDGNWLSAVFPTGEKPLKLKFVKGSNACKLTVSVAFFRLAEGLVSRSADRRSQMIKTEKFDLSGMAFSFKVPSGCLYLLTMSMEYYRGEFPIVDMSLNTGAIYDAQVVKGEYTEGRKFLWAQTGLYFR